MRWQFRGLTEISTLRLWHDLRISFLGFFVDRAAGLYLCNYASKFQIQLPRPFWRKLFCFFFFTCQITIVLFVFCQAEQRFSHVILSFKLNCSIHFDKFFFFLFFFALTLFNSTLEIGPAELSSITLHFHNIFFLFFFFKMIDSKLVLDFETMNIYVHLHS